MKDYKIGITAPPFHPNCRTVLIPYIDDEIQKEIEESAKNTQQKVLKGEIDGYNKIKKTEKPVGEPVVGKKPLPKTLNKLKEKQEKWRIDNKNIIDSKQYTKANEKNQRSV